MKRNEILSRYKKQKSLYQNTCISYTQLLKTIITSNGQNVHDISGRVKSYDSLEKKIVLKGENYNSIEDITDVIGLRIITYFEEDIDKIVKIVKKEFLIDDVNSIDKRETDYDRFGYSSFHYVISLTEARSKLTEYNSISKIKVELQIRTILQHAWAEIEHDIGYKTKDSIPELIKRNFSRLSALLEIADIEFNKLKNMDSNYKSEVPNEIARNPSSVKIDKTSMNSFIQKSNLVNEIDSKIGKKLNCKIEDMGISDDYYNKLLFLNIDNIEELEAQVKKHKNLIVDFAYRFNKTSSSIGWFGKGISIFYLFYVLILEEENSKSLDKYLELFSVKNRRENLKYRLLQVDKEIHAT